MNDFPLKPHTKAILEGRGLQLICAAPICLHQPKGSPDPMYGRAIEVVGHGICNRCGQKTNVQEFIFNPKSRKATPKCGRCGSNSIQVIYTQWVVSKHRKQNHYYYHKECFDAMFRGDKTPFKQRRYRTKYGGSRRGKGVRITLPFDPRQGVCQACGKSKHRKEIKVTALHHWKYAYKSATVAKNPILVLENTVELCFGCHPVADAFRNLMKLSPRRVMLVAQLMPDELVVEFAIIAKTFLRECGL